MFLCLYNRALRARRSAEVDAGNHRGRRDAWKFLSAEAAKSVFDPAEPKELRIHVAPGAANPERVFVRGIVLTEQMVEVAQFESRLLGVWFDAESRCRIRILSPWLKPGRYFVNLYLCERSAILDVLERACRFDVSPALPYVDCLLPESTRHGLVLADFDWVTDETPAALALSRGAEG